MALDYEKIAAALGGTLVPLGATTTFGHLPVAAPVVKERPILFSAPMIRAILAGTKTQTRRVVKPQPPEEMTRVTVMPLSTETAWHDDERGRVWPGRWDSAGRERRDGVWMRCPYGTPGDRLWVRETFKADGAFAKYKTGRVRYCADIEQPAYERGWSPSIHMPQWASRITLEITGVRVERLQEISAEDAVAEGVSQNPDDYRFVIDGEPGKVGFINPVYAFGCLWNSIKGKTYPWASNPWVWVVEFKRLCQVVQESGGAL